MERRKFIKYTGTASACICGSLALSQAGIASQLLHIIEAADKSYTIKGNKLIIDMEKNKVLFSDGGAMKLKFDYRGKKMKILVFRKAGDAYYAFENRCTHGGMPLKYNPETQQIKCTSISQSVFNLDGEVTGGPAPSPIRKFDIIKTNHLLTVTLS
jgi:cytochrome b6-f complex iron-sulfur subunit